MVKKILTFLLAAVLLCSVCACTDGNEQPADTTPVLQSETEQPADATTVTPSETEQPEESPIDYTVFCGNYSDTETVEGPCYTVSIISVDNATGAIEIALSYVGINSSPLYTTESIHASIASYHAVQFEWVDSWSNRGVGTLILDPDDPMTVQLMMTVTEEAEVNRATLSTNNQYKTLIRRQDSDY